MPQRNWIAAAALAATLACTPATAGLIDAVEFYNAALDHYFITAFPDEIGKLDSGSFVGWKRTNLSFKVLDAADTAPGAVKVCRFYGTPAAGLDSHFYSASTAECDAVKQKFPTAWLLESTNVFQAYLPDLATGQCPANTVPVYRSWNNRTDSNHRYTTSASTHDAMIAKGYLAEGYGTSGRPVAMCSPVPPPANPPVCTVGASASSAMTGTSVLLTASCSGTPTSYGWTGCTSTIATCTASSSSAGTVTYSVVAANANGTSAPASVQVAWSAPPPPPPPDPIPVCSLIVTAQNQTPTVNSLVVLEAACSSPNAYQWTNCVSNTNICRVRSGAAGLQTYAVSASNGSGTGAPAVANVNWVATPPASPGLCGQFPSTLYTEAGTNTITAHTLYNEDPAFAWNGVWAVRFTVPPTANPAQTGVLTAYEYGSPATYRVITLSPTACDFRANDATGNNGPLASGNSNLATITFGIGASTPGLAGLTPGATYYLNVRNFYPDGGFITCPSTPGRCDAAVRLDLPR